MKSLGNPGSSHLGWPGPQKSCNPGQLREFVKLVNTVPIWGSAFGQLGWCWRNGGGGELDGAGLALYDAAQGGDDHDHAPAFHVGLGLDGADVLDVLDHFREDGDAGLGVHELAAAELNDEAALVAFFEEAADVLGFEVEIVLVGLGPQLDLFELEGGGAAFGGALLLGLLVLIFAVVHDATYGRVGAGRDFDQVESSLLRQAQGISSLHDAHLVAVFDHSHLRDANALVDPQALRPPPFTGAFTTNGALSCMSLP